MRPRLDPTIHVHLYVGPSLDPNCSLRIFLKYFFEKAYYFKNLQTTIYNLCILLSLTPGLSSDSTRESDAHQDLKSMNFTVFFSMHIYHIQSLTILFFIKISS